MSKAIAYILNPEKTDEKLLVSSYGCASETAAREFEWTRKIAEQKGMNPVRIIARHVIQSFEIGEVTPELAHEIGKQFADEILGGKYEYVLTTHIDKDHVHNHLIFNAVDFVDYHAYKSYKRIYYDMREVSDRLCKENGLSVIPPSQNKGMSYKEYTEAKRGTSWKQKLKQTIDRLAQFFGITGILGIDINQRDLQFGGEHPQSLVVGVQIRLLKAVRGAGIVGRPAV